MCTVASIGTMKEIKKQKGEDREGGGNHFHI